jgi:hypothetical protein
MEYGSALPAELCSNLKNCHGVESAMEQPTKTIGQALRELFAHIKKRPLDWKLIDAFTRLEEQEEAAELQPSELRSMKPSANKTRHSA